MISARKGSLVKLFVNPRSEQLKSLLEVASEHTHLEGLVSRGLPAQLGKLCRFGSYQEGELVLIVSGSAQASMLRLAQHEILGALRSLDAHFQFAWKLKIKVNPHHREPAQPKLPMKISLDNARLLQEEARYTDDAELREVLLKLSRHTRSNDSTQQ